jgi:Zn-dependent M16 (insulinase) family peptidase
LNNRQADVIKSVQFLREEKMAHRYGFEKTREQEIPEMNTRAEIFRHEKTGAELLSLSNEDENKVFGISFRTPPSDSTGVAHILEHSVLCGSRKYPVKEPFVELLKGSLNTFLNAMTYPDKTCYPVASQNVKDFYNLIDVYMDAVLYPRLSAAIFQQEGWHYELDKHGGPLAYKGVVFNEMKGAYSSPEMLLADLSRRSLFPDTPYGFESGGDPRHIPDLTFEQFMEFHRKFYHPSNARIFFYGDDDPDQRLRFLEGYLSDFEPIDIDSYITLQKTFKKPKRITHPYATGEDESGKPRGMVTTNWLLPETRQSEQNLAFHILTYMLLGMPGSPLRKALIDSQLGEDITGEGLGSELRQMYFSTGLKGIDCNDAERMEDLILDTLKGLSEVGIDIQTKEAALNTVEFNLRENNTGSFPRGLGLMLRSLTTWLYNEDPLALIAFEHPLKKLKSTIEKDLTYFEGLIRQFLIDNPHRTTLILEPDPLLTQKEAEEEREKLDRFHDSLKPDDLKAIVINNERLREMQERPDSPEALATIPILKLTDMEPQNKVIPSGLSQYGDVPTLYHDLFTNGIVYIDLGLNLHVLPQKYLPYARLFGRALLEMGTEDEDYVALSQRVSRKTGGIRPAFFSSDVKESRKGEVWLFLRGKTMLERSQELFQIFRDVLTSVRLDNRERFRQIVLEAKARQEQALIPKGHHIVNLRLRSHFSEADWAAEQINGLSYLFFLRWLSEAVEHDWKKVLDDLEVMWNTLINREAMILNVTLDEAGWRQLQPQVDDFMDSLPQTALTRADWTPEVPPEFEGMTIPAQVNYVGKGTNLYQSGYGFHGSALVITRFVRNAWLWERIRLQGGAYGAFCIFDRLSGTLSLVSYRDPNLIESVEVFDQTARFLREIHLDEDELTKSIIGTIGDIDQYRLPDSKGYTSMSRHLTQETDNHRQKMREEVLNTSVDDFRAFAEVLDRVRTSGLVKVLGSQSAIQSSLAVKPDWLEMIKVL